MVLLVKTCRRNVLYHNAPDAGWAWIALVAGFFIMAIAFSITRSLGVFYNDFVEEFESTNSATSWIASMPMAMLGLAAPIGGILIRRFDARKVIMLSGLLCCLGMIISVFASHIWMTYLGVGAIFGMGFSWAYVSTVTQINMYFKRWRGLANGIMTSGSAIGAFTMPLLSQYLVSIYGWRGSMFILAGIGLNITLCGALIRPIKVLTGAEMAKYRELGYADKATDLDEIQAMTVSMEVLDYIQQAEDQRFVETRGGCRICSRTLEVARTFCSDYSLLALYGCAEFAMGMCVFVPIIFINPFAKELGCSDQQAALLLSLTAMGDIVFRPLSGVLLSCVPLLERRILFCLAALAVGQAALCALAALAQGFFMLVGYAVVYGCLYGSIITTKTASIASLLGAENIVKFIGPLFFLSGISSLISPPIAGYLVDLFGSYRVAYWYAMAGFVLFYVLLMACGIGVVQQGGLLPQHRRRTVEAAA